MRERTQAAYEDYCRLAAEPTEANLDRASESILSLVRCFVYGRVKKNRRKFDMDDLVATALLRIAIWYRSAPVPMEFAEWKIELERCVMSGVRRGVTSIKRSIFQIGSVNYVGIGRGSIPNDPQWDIYLAEVPEALRKMALGRLRVHSAAERAAAVWTVNRFIDGKVPNVRSLMRGFGLNMEQATYIAEHARVLVQSAKLHLLKSGDRPDFSLVGVPIEACCEDVEYDDTRDAN